MQCSILTVKGGFYILKPDSGSEGAGIQLAEAEQVLEKSSAMTEGLRQAGKSGNVVVQHYIATPHLFSGGLKYDMRLYVLVTSIVPLQVYICKEGLVRFCTREYCAPSKDNIDDTTMHLTNYTLNRKSERFVQGPTRLTAGSKAGMNEGSFEHATKRPLSVFLSQLKEERNDFSEASFWETIRRAVVITLASMRPRLVLAHKNTFSSSSKRRSGESRSSFHILGVDVLWTTRCSHG